MTTHRDPFRFARRFEAFGFEEGENEQAQLLRKLRESGSPFLDLTQSNPTLAGIPYPEDAIRAALSNEQSLRYRPAPAGLDSARDAIAGYYAERGWSCMRDHLVLTSGTSEAYSFLFRLLCDTGDTVLVPTPGYPLFDFIAALDDVAIRPYLLRESAPGWHYDVAAIEDALTPDTRAVIVVQPNNPTGTIATREFISALLALADTHRFAIIVDEVFCDYCREAAAFQPFHSAGPLVFTLNGFSKVLGLPQMKLGWIRMDGAVDAIAMAQERLELIADTFLSVNTPVQVAAPALLALRGPIQSAIRRRIETNLELLRRTSGATFHEPAGGWYAVLHCGDDCDDETLALQALENGVYVHPGHMFGFVENCRQVVSLITPEPEFAEGIAKLMALISR